MKARIFGAGSIGNHLTNALRELEYKVEVVDIDETALLRMQNAIYPSRYGKWDKNITLLKEASDNLVDLEIIGTPPDTHANILLDRIIAEKSKYWLVEKPFTIPSKSHINELENKILKYKDSIFVGYNHSVSPVFRELLKDLKDSDAPSKISCSWEEHWGGIFQAHPWLDGPNDSYLGFKERGGGSLMEHSHGLHLLIILFDKFNLEIEKINSSIILDNYKNYDKKSYLSFELNNKNINAFYSTDVISNEINKSLTIETKENIFSVKFSSDNGKSDTYIKKDKFKETIKKFKKTRADDFISEMKLIDNLLRNNSFDKSLNNISCNNGLKVASICANIFDNN
ncbi:MAG: hypothetical protein CMK49_01005 [Prochlorococcus sp. SP3034]|nr:hypothetical protein [Prochlorococcus sp. SP3034]|tara:strand:- start:23652 stop:24674 length:1023 start_codon:yes stop_codon:yes gene_type:complete